MTCFFSFIFKFSIARCLACMMYYWQTNHFNSKSGWNGGCSADQVCSHYAALAAADTEIPSGISPCSRCLLLHDTSHTVLSPPVWNQLQRCCCTSHPAHPSVSRSATFLPKVMNDYFEYRKSVYECNCWGNYLIIVM